MRRFLIKALCLCLLLSMCLPLASCARNGLNAYKEDKETGKDGYYVAMMVADYGEIILYLDATVAPITVEHFVALVRDDFYSGTTFHRVISNFMIQGGAPKGNKRPGNVVGEFLANGHYNTLSHKRGVISMARADDFNSASSQFFICNADSPHLDYYYAAFGWVVSGMEVVDAITSSTAGFGNSNGMISDTSRQAVIAEMKVIVYEE